MELKKLFIGMMACAAVAACTNDEFVDEKGNEVFNADSYIAINIVSPSSSATRAANAGFEDGTGNENVIKSAKFFFFDADGNGCAAPATPTLTFPDNSGNGNFEKISDAVVVLKNPTTIPTQIIAILNPTTAVAGLTQTTTLAKLRSIVESYSNILSENGFMMSNSVYLDANKAVVDATALPAGSVCKTEDLAKASPVMIPVERVVAKVTTALNGKSSTKVYTIDNKEYTLKTELLGWLITNLNPSSNLLKKIDPAFNGFVNWNDAANFRSYWANSSTPENYQFFSYSAIAAHTSGDAVYCLENTLENPTDSTTKVIVAGKIVATPVGGGSSIDNFSLMEWAGTKYTPDGMKKLITTIQEIKQYYIIDVANSTPEETKYKTLTAGNFDFAPFDSDPANQSFVKAVLASNAPDIFTITENNGKKTATPVTRDAVNANLATLGKISYWKNGMTYFYTDIIHYNTTTPDSETLGVPGVIRNHSYKLTINSVTGLGNPVPYNNVEIIPGGGGAEDWYIAAKVEILNWRIVNQTVDLN